MMVSAGVVAIKPMTVLSFLVWSLDPPHAVWGGKYEGKWCQGKGVFCVIYVEQIMIAFLMIVSVTKVIINASSQHKKENKYLHTHHNNDDNNNDNHKEHN